MNFEFRKHKVAGSENDFMEVTHLILKGSNKDIGLKMGEIARTFHETTELLPLDPKIKEAHINYIRANYPILYNRMLGIAEAYGENIDESNKCLSMLQYNISTPFCSTIYYPPEKTASGHATVSRNYDFTTGTIFGTSPEEGQMPATSRPYIISMYPDIGYPSLYLCAYDLLNGVIDGINSEGLVIVIHGADELLRDNPIKPTFLPSVGLNELQLPRLILDTCATIEEAKECFIKYQKYFLYSPFQYLVADRTGHSMVFEPSLNKKIANIIPNNGKCQILTNFMLSNYNTIDDIPTVDDSKYFKMYSRYLKIHERLNAVKTSYTDDFIRETNKCVFFEKGFREEIDRALFGKGDKSSSISDRTLWHSIYDCHERNVQISFYLSEEQRTDYLKFVL